MKRISLYAFVVIAAFGCKRNQNIEGSQVASISIGEVPDEKLPNDSFKLVVKTGSGNREFINNEQLAATSFKVGETVTLSLELSLGTKVVAKSIPGHAKCSEETATLIAGNNTIIVDICQLDDKGEPIGVIQTEISNIDVKPCIVGKEDCDAKPADPAKDPAAAPAKDPATDTSKDPAKDPAAKP